MVVSWTGDTRILVSRTTNCLLSGPVVDSDDLVLDIIQSRLDVADVSLIHHGSHIVQIFHKSVAFKLRHWLHLIKVAMGPKLQYVILQCIIYINSSASCQTYAINEL